jgi:uncharacterized protein (TIGR03435 family)
MGTDPAFDVASIRPHQGPLRVIAGFTASGPRLRLEGYNLRLLVMEAYNVRGYRVSFAGSDPEREQRDTYYDIEALAEGTSSPAKEAFRQMLQSLLAQRFKLRFHWEVSQMFVYAIVVGKDGPKLKDSAPDQKPNRYIGVHGRNQSITASKETMGLLADDIECVEGPGLPVVDETGLKGAYEIQFEATPEWRIGNNPQPEDLSLFDAVQDQLGLKLERRKVAVEILVVDHIEKPSEN